MGIGGHNDDITGRNNEVDDDLPSVEEMLGPISRREFRREETGMLKLHCKISISQLSPQMEPYRRNTVKIG